MLLTPIYSMIDLQDLQLWQYWPLDNFGEPTVLWQVLFFSTRIIQFMYRKNSDTDPSPLPFQLSPITNQSATVGSKFRKSWKNGPSSPLSDAPSPFTRHQSQKGFMFLPQSDPVGRLSSPEEFPRKPRAPSSTASKDVILQLISSGSKKGLKALKITSSTNSTEPPKLTKGKSTPAFLRNQFRTRNMGNFQSGISKESFQMIRRLGEGKFGTVFLARQRQTGMIVGLKVVQKKRILQDNFLNQFIRQIKIQSSLEHPNIIKIYGFFHDQDHFYIVLELGCDGQLFDIVSQKQQLSQETVSFVTGNLLDALQTMHKKKILHRDIKPQNIVLVHGNVKLCDFGWAVNKKQELRSTFCGTPLYLSPQVMKGCRYDQKVDVWAVGVLAYELYFGTSPFDINEHDELFKIVTQQIIFPSNRQISQQFRQFLLQILRKDPAQRKSSGELMQLSFIKRYRELETCEQLCQ